MGCCNWPRCDGSLSIFEINGEKMVKLPVANRLRETIIITSDNLMEGEFQSYLFVNFAATSYTWRLKNKYASKKTGLMTIHSQCSAEGCPAKKYEMEQKSENGTSKFVTSFKGNHTCSGKTLLQLKPSIDVSKAAEEKLRNGVSVQNVVFSLLFCRHCLV
jgi:hypothetical protein